MRRTTPPLWLVFFATTFVAFTTGVHTAAAASRAWLGVYTQEITDELRDGLELRGGGVLVNRVLPDSPAERAGVRQGDVIVSFNSRTVSSPGNLSELVGNASSGQSIALAIVRDGERKTLSATLGQRPADEDGEAPAPEDAPRWQADTPDAPQAPAAPETPVAPRAPGARHDVRMRVERRGADGQPHVYRFDGDAGQMPEEVRGLMRDFGVDGQHGPGNVHALVFPSGRGRLGVRIETLNDDLATALGSSGTKGALVLEVLKDTPAEKAGLKAGDIVTAVGGHKVYDADDLVSALRDENGTVSLSITRKGATRTIEAALEAAPRAMRMGRGEGAMGLGRIRDLDRITIRPRAQGRADGDDLRQQLDELRQQLRELRQQLEEKHHD